MKARSPVLLFFLFFLFCLLIAFLQPLRTATDEQNHLASLKGKEKLDFLLEKTGQYNETAPQKALRYGKEALERMKKKPQNVKKAILLNDLCWACKNLEKYKEALKYGTAAAKIAITINEKKALSDAYFCIAIAHWRLSEYPQALKYHFLALELRKKLGNEGKVYESLSNIGGVYQSLGIFDLALDYYLKTLQIQEKWQGNEVDVANTINKIGVVYYNLGDLEKAVSFYTRALELQQKLRDKRGMADCLNNIGVIYQEKGSYQKAKDFYTRSLKLEEEMGNKSGLAIGFNNIGEVYQKTGKPAKALEHYIQSIKLAREVGDLYGVAYTLNNIGVVHREAGNFSKALENGHNALNIARNIQARDLEKDIHKELFTLHKAMGNYRSAFNSHVKFKALNDDIFNMNNRQKIMEMQNRYEIHKKEKEIELLKKERTIRELDFNQQKIQKYALLFGLLLGIVVLLLLYNRYRLKVKANNAIRQKNSELTTAYEKLEEAARTDHLTGLSNRRDMMKQVRQEETRSERNKKPFVVVLCDVDFFKPINDTYGHACGDFVLAELAKVMRSSIRKQDGVARWGGEEFFMLLPETNLEGAMVVTEKVRKRIEEHLFVYEENAIKVTMTFGLCQTRSGNVEEAMKHADAALYEGKRKGKNCVKTPNDLPDSTIPKPFL